MISKVFAVHILVVAKSAALTPCLISSTRKSTPKGYNSKSLLQAELSLSYSYENPGLEKKT